MSNLLAVFKATDQIVSKLLDHTKFTDPEINYLVRGLDANLNLKDSLDKVLKTNEHVHVISDLSDEQRPSGLFDSEPLRRLDKQVLGLIERADRLLKIEDDFRLRETRELSESRQRRANELELAEKEAQIKLDKVRETLLAEELELERKYLKLEENLRSAC